MLAYSTVSKGPFVERLGRDAGVTLSTILISRSRCCIAYLGCRRHVDYVSWAWRQHCYPGTPSPPSRCSVCSQVHEWCEVGRAWDRLQLS